MRRRSFLLPAVLHLLDNFIPQMGKGESASIVDSEVSVNLHGEVLHSHPLHCLSPHYLVLLDQTRARSLESLMSKSQFQCLACEVRRGRLSVLVVLHEVHELILLSTLPLGSNLLQLHTLGLSLSRCRGEDWERVRRRQLRVFASESEELASEP